MTVRVILLGSTTSVRGHVTVPKYWFLPRGIVNGGMANVEEYSNASCPFYIPFLDFTFSAMLYSTIASSISLAEALYTSMGTRRVS